MVSVLTNSALLIAATAYSLFYTAIRALRLVHFTIGAVWFLNHCIHLQEIVSTQ